MARPIPVSNQKIRDWNLFLTHLNEKAKTELPQDAAGNPRWELLDKNEAFGNYAGGQDYYKKKFDEFSQAHGTNSLTQADFPVMQKLYQDVYSGADPAYKTKFIDPTLQRQGVDITTFNPHSTITNKQNTEGWIGSVSRNFYIPQDVHEGTGGTQIGQKDFKEAIFPESFNQGEPFYKKNPGGTGVRYFDDGGKLNAFQSPIEHGQEYDLTTNQISILKGHGYDFEPIEKKKFTIKKKKDAISE